MADKLKGLTIEIGGDTTKLSQALKEPNKNVSDLQAKLKTLDSALKLDPKNTDLLSQKQRILSETIEATKDKLELLKQSQKEYIDSKKNLDSKEYIELEKQIAQTEKALKNLESQQKTFSNTLKDVGGKLEDIGEKATDVGKKWTKSTAAITAGLTLSVKKTADFDKEISNVAASMGTTVDEINDISESAKELGRSTAFSATEAAQGYNILAQSGLNAKDQISALPTILDLAAAGNISIEQSAKYATGAVKGFGDEMGNVSTYTNIIAKGATLAKTNVNELGEALSGSSSSANAYSQTVESTTTALLRLANQNVVGSQAATMLNRAMMDLYAPTAKSKEALMDLGVEAYKTDGTAKDFNELVKELNDSLSGMSEEERNAALNAIFTTNGLNAFNKMIATSNEETNAFIDALSNVGDAASEQAATQLDNLSGDVTIMNSALEGIALTVGDILNPIIRDLVQLITQLLTWFSNLNPTLQTIIVLVLSVVAAIGPLLLAFGTIITLVGKATTAFGVLSGFFGKFVPLITGPVMTALKGLWALMKANPISILITAIVAIIAILVTMYNKCEWFRNGVDKIVSALTSKVKGGVDKVLGFFNSIKSLLSNAWTWGSDFVSGFANGIMSHLSNLKDKVMSVADTIRSFLHFSRPDVGPLKDYETWMPDFMKGLAGGIRKNRGLVIDEIEKLSNNLTLTNDVSRTFNSNQTFTANIPISVDLDGKPIYRNVETRTTRKQSNANAFKGDVA